MKGILLIALGHSNYYKMAAALAASIRVCDTLPICLITDIEVPEKHKFLFDKIKKPSKKSITTSSGNTEYIMAKLYMYDFSPYEETIFLDVDQIMIPNAKLSPIFIELQNVDLTFSNTGLAETSVWCDMKEVKNIYGDKPFWNFHSELVYFKKGDKVKAYFDVAKKVFLENKITSATKFSGATMADELAFQVAAIITGLYPHKENYTPNFWYERNQLLGNKYPYQLTDFVTYSIGGKVTPSRIKANYDVLSISYFNKLGLSHPYKVVSKQNFLPERKLI